MSLSLVYKTTELTTGEQMSVEKVAERSNVLEMVSFILARTVVVGQGDTEALARELFSRPYSETRRYFHEALVAAMPATRAACEAVDREFADQLGGDNKPAEAEFPDHIG